MISVGFKFNFESEFYKLKVIIFFNKLIIVKAMLHRFWTPIHTEKSARNSACTLLLSLMYIKMLKCYSKFGSLIACLISNVYVNHTNISNRFSKVFVFVKVTNFWIKTFYKLVFSLFLLKIVIENCLMCKHSYVFSLIFFVFRY